MANAIDLPTTTRRSTPPSSSAERKRTCEAVSTQTKQPCTEPAERCVEWGDGSKSWCCPSCAEYLQALAHENRCPTYVRVH